jgi:hypothetical protein
LLVLEWWRLARAVPPESQGGKTGPLLPLRTTGVVRAAEAVELEAEEATAARGVRGARFSSYLDARDTPGIRKSAAHAATQPRITHFR